MISKDDDKDIFRNAIPIAGELKEKGGGYLEPTWTRLKTSKLEADAGKEGLRLDIQGGFKKTDDGKRKQKAVINFFCDKSREGDENLWDPEDKYEPESAKRELGPKDPSLQYVSYDTSGKSEDVLTLSWWTKYACEESKQEQDAEKAGRWGFFTWFIIMYVLQSQRLV